ncbi:hypothetical protein M3J09_013596 [Ascochyta lentis]
MMPASLMCSWSCVHFVGCAHTTHLQAIRDEIGRLPALALNEMSKMLETASYLPEKREIPPGICHYSPDNSPRCKRRATLRVRIERRLKSNTGVRVTRRSTRVVRDMAGESGLCNQREHILHPLPLGSQVLLS